MSDPKTPDFLVGTGLETDMSGDARPSGFRFWLKQGVETKITFLTNGEDSPVLWEHQVLLDGSWKNWFTCLEPLKVPCPLCAFADKNEGKHRRYKGQFFTIIDHSEYKNKQGVLVKDVKKILVAKKDPAELIKRRYIARRDAGENLRGAQFKVFRGTSDRSSNIGDDYEFIKMNDLSAYPDTEEFNWAETLAPNKDKVEKVVEKLGVSSGVKAEGEGTSHRVDL